MSTTLILGLRSCFYEMACARKIPFSHSQSVYRYNSHQLSKKSSIAPNCHSEILVLHKHFKLQIWKHIRFFRISCCLSGFSYIFNFHRSTPLDICQGACSRVSRAYIARRMHLPQDLLLRRRVSPFGFFRAQRLHSIMVLFVVLIYTFLTLLALSTSLWHN